MRIREMQIKGLYGYINKNIKFNNDVTLLVGINGSGKTSILNLISWIFKPSLPLLCVTQFKNVKLLFTFKKVDYTIECKHLKTTFQYVLTSSKPKKKYAPLIVKLKVHPSELSGLNELRNSTMESYENLKPDSKEEGKTWSFINTLPNPITIGLDRILTSQTEDFVYLEGTPGARLVRTSERKIITPLDKVIEIVNEEYRIRKNERLSLTDGLKYHLMLSSFEGNISLDSVRLGVQQKLTLTQIEFAEKRIKEFFNKYEKTVYSKKEKSRITNYFLDLKNITNQYLEKPDDRTAQIIYELNTNHFIKLQKLLTEFERVEIKSSKIFEHINLYLNTVNKFFKDSFKKLIFKEDTSELTYNVLDKNGKTLVEFKDVNHLSSGEQQILILFSHIAFNRQAEKLFLIDEPELSLHVKWQEDFLDLLEKLTPKATQIFLATHSPILVGKKKSKAVLLYPYD
ncbi:MAG: AAA family ATPase [Candidatus Anammoxibacter sp.]